MALWGKTDDVLDRPNWINLSNYPVGTRLIFVDETEAQQAGTKAKGISGPGWWLFYEYEDIHGNTRFNNELIVAMRVDRADAGDNVLDDDVAVNFSIASVDIGEDIETGTGATIEGVVTLSGVVADADLVYQWEQWDEVEEEWVNITNSANVSGATTDTLVIVDAEPFDGAQIRLYVSDVNGAIPAVASNVVTITFVLV